MAAARDNKVKATSEAAGNFVEWYYRALNDGTTLNPFYTTASIKYLDAGVASDISINGAHLGSTPLEYQKLLETQRQLTQGSARVHFEVEGWDVQVLNPDFALACPPGLQGTAGGGGGRESLLVQVAGQISYGSDKDAPRKAFNETFVLVPNWDALGKNAPRGARRKLILSQNFREL